GLAFGLAVFFFQAEDGIRDFHVTGVQTCALPISADRETLLVEQAADLANHEHVLALVVAAIPAALDRLELRKLLLPVAQHVRLHAAQLAHLADREVTLPRNRRQFAVIAWFQHTPQLAP